MSTYGGTLPQRRNVAQLAWFAILAIVVAVTIWAALTVLGRTPTSAPRDTGGATTTRIEPGRPYEPIVVNGHVCGQCM